MCKNSEPWVFTLPEDFSWDSGFTVPGEWEFRDKTGAVRLILRQSGRITVTRRYAWDWCSTKMFVFDILLGTADSRAEATTPSGVASRMKVDTHLGAAPVPGVAPGDGYPARLPKD